MKIFDDDSDVVLERAWRRIVRKDWVLNRVWTL